MAARRTYRKEGYLRRLNQQGKPKHLFFFDTETYIKETNNLKIDLPFRLGFMLYYRLDKDANVKYSEQTRIDGNKQFFRYIEDRLGKNDKAYVFAHNIGFDARVLGIFREAHKRGYESKPPIINNFVFIWVIKKGKQSIVFVDTANYGVRSVQALGESMGYEKGEVDFETVTDDELYEYCKRDVEIIAKFMISYISFIHQHKLGNFKLTLAAQSLQAYRTRFNNEDIYLHMLHGAFKLERDAYYGGRTECFQLGEINDKKTYYLDVNSMYPYVMSSFDLPVKLLAFHKGVSLKKLRDYKDYYLIADVTIETKERIYPLRLTSDISEYNYLHNPYNNDIYPEKKSRRLIFPVGRFRTTLHDIELSRALANGEIKKVHRLAIYEKGQPFNDYVDFFYARKVQYTVEDNQEWRRISKLFLNSLYGKFGQLLPHREQYDAMTDREIGRLTTLDVDTGLRYQDLFWFGNIYKEYKQGETAFSSPAIAGAITAYARYVLYGFIEIAGEENVYYMDTDSLMVNQKGYENLKPYIDPTKLGYLDLEHEGSTLIIHGNKDYRIDDTVRFKGLPPKAKLIRDNLWSYVQFTGFITWLNGGGIGGATARHATKSRKGEYHKGIVGDDNRIEPYTLLEDY